MKARLIGQPSLPSKPVDPTPAEIVCMGELFMDGPWVEVSRPKVHFITPTDGDWIRMYIDGKFIMEGHSLSIEGVAAALVGELNVTSEEWEDELAYERCYDSDLDIINREIRPTIGNTPEDE